MTTLQTNPVLNFEIDKASLRYVGQRPEASGMYSRRAGWHSLEC